MTTSARGLTATQPATQAHVEVEIGELVLHGFAPGQRYAIADALAHELQRLLAERGVPSLLHADTALARLEAGRFAASGDGRPALLGIGIARALYEGMHQ
jgi:hypothetical protein